MNAIHEDDAEYENDLPEAIECYKPGCDGKPQTVTAPGRVVDRADPTQTYKLACGHVVI